jgi:hypothetical protein
MDLTEGLCEGLPFANIQNFLKYVRVYRLSKYPSDLVALPNLCNMLKDLWCSHW